MKTFIYSIGLFLLSFGALNAQPFIQSHFLNKEYCPGVQEIVEVVVPGGYTLLDVLGGAGVTSVQYFTDEPFGSGRLYSYFVTFADVNRNADIIISHISNDDGFVVDPWEFTRVQSFAFSETESIIQPNVSSLLVPICGSLLQNITFPEVQFSNDEISGDAFGEVTDYEFDIPANWSLLNVSTSTTTVSDGVSSIVAGNDVMISSNNTPVDDVIRIRPLNPCDPTLTPGEWVEIPVTRDIPTINISGGPICGPTVFDINKYSSAIPSWAVGWTWSVSPSSLVSIQGGNVNSMFINVVPVAGASGTATISLTFFAGPSCGQSVTYTKNVFVGSLPSIPTIIGPDCYDPGENIWVFANSTGADTFEWGVPNDWIIYTQNPSPSNQAFIHIGNQAGSVSVWATNECGTVSKNEEVEFCDKDPDEGPIKDLGQGSTGNAQWMQQMEVFPNPASEQLTVKFNSLPELGTDDMQVNLLDVNGRVLRQAQVLDYELEMNVSDIPAGMYYLQVLNGDEMSHQKVIIK